MLAFSWLREQIGARSPIAGWRGTTAKPVLRRRCRVEALEDRTVPSTVTVLNDYDSGAGSLRAAISTAHNGDTIKFAPVLVGPTGQTIKLTSGDLFIKHNITIAGPSDRSVTISGGNASRVIELSLNPKPTVTLSGLTISDGYAPGPFGHSTDNGGGILNEGTLTVSNCTVSHNNAPEGAGILNDSGATLTVSNSTISYNTGRDERGSSEGGGIDNYGTLVIHGSNLSYNSVSGAGGAVATALGVVIIDNQSVLSDNSANVGGAIRGSIGANQTVTINDSILSDNFARELGGAISFSPGKLTLNRCTLTGNSAIAPPGQTWITRGGAIYVSDGSPIGSAVTLSGCTLTGNSAVQGGGIYVGSGGYGPVTVSVSGCTLSGNVAATSGGAIYMTSNGYSNVNVSMTVIGCTLTSNVATSGNGGGIFNNSISGTLMVSNSTFGDQFDSSLANTPENIFGAYVDGGGNNFW